MLTEELLHGVDFVIVLIAEVLHVVDAVPLCSLPADCAVLDVRLSIQIGRIDLDLCLHHEEQAHLLTVVNGIRVLELPG